MLTRAGIKRVQQDDIDYDSSFKDLPSPISKKKLQKRTLQNSINDITISNDLIPQYGVRGLINLGSSCYINSVMQVLIHTPALCRYFLLGRHKCSEAHASVCQICELAQIFEEYYTGSILPPMSLHRLLYLVWLQIPSLAGLEQQDAHEFYMTYIQLLHDSCLHSDESCLCAFNDLTKLTACNCIIDQLYAGILESNLTCTKCQNTSSKREVFYDISLELDAFEMEDLYDCLKNYTKSESLNESCNIYCTICDSNQEFVKKLGLVVLPNVLNINFKRFILKGSTHKKLTNHVVFPFELNLKPFASDYAGDTNDHIYSLIAVISHSGSMNSGHYTVFIRQTEDVWVLYNDHKIKAVSPDIVLDTEAYILVYEKNKNIYQ